MDNWISYGASVRAAQYLVLGGKARALTQGRYHVNVEDIQALAYPVLRHRILRNFRAESEQVGPDRGSSGSRRGRAVPLACKPCRCRARDSEPAHMTHPRQPIPPLPLPPGGDETEPATLATPPIPSPAPASSTRRCWPA